MSSRPREKEEGNRHSRWRALLCNWGVDPRLGWMGMLLAVVLAPPTPLPRDWRVRFAALFPQVNFRRPRPLDPIRFLIQLAWLALVTTHIPVASPPPGPRLVGAEDGRQRRRLVRFLLDGCSRVWRDLAIARRSLGTIAHRFERGSDAIAARVQALPWVRFIAYSGWTAAAVLLITTPFEAKEQALLSLLLVLTALSVRRITGQAVQLLLVALSVIATARYLWWRVTYTLSWDKDLDLILGVVLLIAECYAVLVLFLGYFQTARPLRRDPVPLPEDQRTWPSVDIYIPTYNEPLEVVMPTVIAALAMDWPQDKFKVYVLDDGGRESFRRFAEEVGAGYIARSEHTHAKAGNLNHALGCTTGDYVAIFDCDHVPTRAFLRLAMGWFLRDPRLALVQTPHHFFSPDPFERNLGMFRRMPNEGELFHGLIQDGNDLWNATFFCGSCAVLKRSALVEIGGVAVETVTEDAHTALKLQRRGYATALVNVPLAAGLATESLSAHIGQRIRWARGMAQIFRIDNPFLGRGLTWAQRICYGSAMLHFFNGVPRLIFLTAPAAFLLAHAFVIHAAALEVVLYVLPHLVHATVTNSALQGRHRRSFWSEIYETVLAWYIARPTTVALLDPSRGKFNVTQKGGMTPEGYFDWKIAAPFLALAGVNLIAFSAGIGRMAWGPADEIGTVLINMAWCVYNLTILGAAIAVAFELKQRRALHRAPLELDGVLRTPAGHSLPCITKDVSPAGAAIALRMPGALAAGDAVVVSLPSGSTQVDFRARVMAVAPQQISLSWEPLSREQTVALVECTLSRPDAWMAWQRDRQPDRVVEGMRDVVSNGASGYRQLASHTITSVKKQTHPLVNVARRSWWFAASFAPRTPIPVRPS